MPTVLTLTDDPKCFKATVGDITRLDLSSRDLKFQDLKALGLSRFPRLEQLDVSDNNLTSFPENLPLQHLRKLNCSNNRLKDVTFLKQFPKLEEISIEMNLVNVNEEYIAVHMLPNLVLYNGRSTQYARKMTTNYENKLSAKLHRIWKDKYEDLYAGISSLLESARIEKALKRRLQDVPCGPASLQHLKDYLIAYLVQKHMSIAKEEKESSEKEKKRKTAEPPKKKQKIGNGKEKEDKWSSSRKIKMKGTGLPRNFTPVHFIRCHSKTNDPDDEDNRVWRCAFEPDPNNKGDTTNIVATCGSDSVCLLDCKSGKVMKKYKQPNEDFYAIAWTTVVMEIGGKETPTNLLAAAGKSCQIRLLYPAQLICYANTPANKQPINVLLFHPEKPTWLFSGTREAVTLWDIGIPKLPNYGCQPRQLCSFKAVSDVLNLAVLPRTGQRSGRLIGGCDDGIYGWDLDDKIDSKTRQVSVEYLLPSCKQKEEIFVDGLAVVQDDIIATKFSRLTEDDEFVSDSVIHIWNVTETDSQLGKRKTDFEIIPTKVVHTLQWKSINEIYLYLSCRKDSGVVAAGDDKGNIHLYDVSKVTSSKVKGDSIAASQVLDWPNSVLDDDSDYILINHIDISSDLKTIVAVTQNNIVCVWKAK